MKVNTLFARTAIALCLHTCILVTAFAHNGAVAYANPVSQISIDGDLSDWPKGMTSYAIAVPLSDDKPTSPADYSGSFRVGYAEHYLYFALEVSDDQYIEDTSANASWNTQDGLEFYIDAQHIPDQSGVISFMYTTTHKHINKSDFDAFAKSAGWDNILVQMKTNKTGRTYEIRIDLGEFLIPGTTVGADFQIFDRDPDGSFTICGWGKGGWKFTNASSLGDIVLLPENQAMGKVSGRIAWDKPIDEQLPSSVRLYSVSRPDFIIDVETDTTGTYQAQIPVGTYTVSIPGKFYRINEQIYPVDAAAQATVEVRATHTVQVPKITIKSTVVPDLIPEKGILLNDTPGWEKQVDAFIESYMAYYQIPGVSFAVIKDGELAYANTYGVTNHATKAPVDSKTVFEAASITKPVFTHAVLRLAERGVLDLHKPLYLYLPYPDIAYDDRYKLMTAMHVLTHRTGFPNWRSENPDNKLDLKFTPGTAYQYSGEGFEYLKKVVEKITGKPVEQVLQEEVIQPMQLYHTCFSIKDSVQEHVAYGHYDLMPTSNTMHEEAGMAYSMYTEARAFTRFMEYLLEGKGLRPETYEDMFAMHSEFKFDEGQVPKYPIYMGISLEIRKSPFGLSFGHGGNNGDFTSQFEVYKDLGIGYAVFTNGSTSYPLLQNMRKVLVEGKE